MDIDEYACLQEWCKIKDGNLETMALCDTLYRRYLNKIVIWEDEEGNYYSYIKENIIIFTSIHNSFASLEYKFNLMKKIDGDIMYMMSMCLMRDMNI